MKPINPQYVFWPTLVSLAFMFLIYELRGTLHNIPGYIMTGIFITGLTVALILYLIIPAVNWLLELMDL